MIPCFHMIPNLYRITHLHKMTNLHLILVNCLSTIFLSIIFNGNSLNSENLKFLNLDMSFGGFVITLLTIYLH